MVHTEKTCKNKKCMLIIVLTSLVEPLFKEAVYLYILHC